MEARRNEDYEINKKGKSSEDVVEYDSGVRIESIISNQFKQRMIRIIL